MNRRVLRSLVGLLTRRVWSGSSALRTCQSLRSVWTVQGRGVFSGFVQSHVCAKERKQTATVPSFHRTQVRLMSKRSKRDLSQRRPSVKIRGSCVEQFQMLKESYKAIIRDILAMCGLLDGRTRIEVFILNEGEMRKSNKKARGVDECTDVVSLQHNHIPSYTRERFIAKPDLLQRVRETEGGDDDRSDLVDSDAPRIVADSRGLFTHGGIYLCPDYILKKYRPLFDDDDLAFTREVLTVRNDPDFLAQLTRDDIVYRSVLPVVLTHAVCHILGHDHKAGPDKAIAMYQQEVKILEALRQMAYPVPDLEPDYSSEAPLYWQSLVEEEEQLRARDEQRSQEEQEEAGEEDSHAHQAHRQLFDAMYLHCVGDKRGTATLKQMAADQVLNDGLPQPEGYQERLAEIERDMAKPANAPDRKVVVDAHQLRADAQQAEAVSDDDVHEFEWDEEDGKSAVAEDISDVVDAEFEHDFTADHMAADPDVMGGPALASPEASLMQQTVEVGDMAALLRRKLQNLRSMMAEMGARLDALQKVQVAARAKERGGVTMPSDEPAEDVDAAVDAVIADMVRDGKVPDEETARELLQGMHGGGELGAPMQFQPVLDALNREQAEGRQQALDAGESCDDDEDGFSDELGLLGDVKGGDSGPPVSTVVPMTQALEMVHQLRALEVREQELATTLASMPSTNSVDREDQTAVQKALDHAEGLADLSSIDPRDGLMQGLSEEARRVVPSRLREMVAMSQEFPSADAASDAVTEQFLRD